MRVAVFSSVTGSSKTCRVIVDDVFSRLLTFPNVTVTGHQAFFARNALEQIAETTGANLDAFEDGSPCDNELHWKDLRSH